MKILIITNKVFYDRVKGIANKLENLGHEISYPNCIKNSNAEQEAIDNNNFIEFKQDMYKQSAEKIKEIDAVLVLNYDKNNQPNYIGGATFIEF